MVDTHQTCRDLVDGRSYFHDPKGNPVPGKNIDQEMLRLSLDYGVLSKRTAFVAIEEREQATEGTMQIRKIPITFENGNPPNLVNLSRNTHADDV